VFAFDHMSHQQAILNDHYRTLIDSKRRVAEMSTEKKVEDKLSHCVLI